MRKWIKSSIHPRSTGLEATGVRKFLHTHSLGNIRKQCDAEKSTVMKDAGTACCVSKGGHMCTCAGSHTKRLPENTPRGTQLGSRGQDGEKDGPLCTCPLSSLVNLLRVSVIAYAGFYLSRYVVVQLLSSV